MMTEPSAQGRPVTLLPAQLAYSIPAANALDGVGQELDPSIFTLGPCFDRNIFRAPPQAIT